MARQKTGRTSQQNTQDNFYSSKRWRHARRLAGIAAQMLCEVHRRHGVEREGRIGDHLIPRSQQGAELDLKNIAWMCDACHDTKRLIERNHMQKLLKTARPAQSAGGGFLGNIPLDRTGIFDMIIGFNIRSGKMLHHGEE